MDQKFILAGPAGAGKTTAIATVSDIPVISMDSAVANVVTLRQATTSMTMDYGVLRLGSGIKLHLYGTPGRERFGSTWDIVVRDGMGLALMLDQSRPDAVGDLMIYLGAFHRFVVGSGGAVVVGVTRMDLQPRATVDPIRDKLQSLGLNVPVFEVDARRHQDVKQLLLALHSILDPVVRRFQ